MIKNFFKLFKCLHFSSKNNLNFLKKDLRFFPISVIFVAIVSGCAGRSQRPHFLPPVATDKPYSVKGKRYYPKRDYEHHSEGLASYYGKGFHGQKTACGERFDASKLTAAHKSLQLPCIAKVTNCQNGKTVIVRINDRGPFHKNRILDVSYEAARQLGFVSRGVARVRLQVLKTPSLKAETYFFAKKKSRPHRRCRHIPLKQKIFIKNKRLYHPKNVFNTYRLART